MFVIFFENVVVFVRVSNFQKKLSSSFFDFKNGMGNRKNTFTGDNEVVAVSYDYKVGISIMCLGVVLFLLLFAVLNP